jgi:hypothetical protein
VTARYGEQSEEGLPQSRLGISPEERDRTKGKRFSGEAGKTEKKYSINYDAIASQTGLIPGNEARLFLTSLGQLHSACWEIHDKVNPVDCTLTKELAVPRDGYLHPELLKDPPKRRSGARDNQPTGIGLEFCDTGYGSPATLD